MFDDDLFDYLTPQEGKTSDFTLYGVFIPRDSESPVVLELLYAGKGSPYWNALLKLKPLEDEQAATVRAARLFARHSIKGWKNVTKDGQPIPFSVDGAAEILIKLVTAKRQAKADQAIQHAMNPDNFTPPRVEAGEVGKP